MKFKDLVVGQSDLGREREDGDLAQNYKYTHKDTPMKRGGNCHSEDGVWAGLWGPSRSAR